MPLTAVANSNVALTRNTPRIPSRVAHNPASNMAANCASDVSDADAPLTRPRSSGGVSPCNITLAAITTTATPIPMPADPISAAAVCGTTAISKIDAPTPAMPLPISHRGSRPPANPLNPAEPTKVPTAISEPISPSTVGPRCNTSRT